MFWMFFINVLNGRVLTHAFFEIVAPLILW